ncbi:MAG: hypothetical protein KBA77_02535, partial [Synergistales bacterium]|nr:hypothetical protein [Synergistales bacterium]
MTLTLLIIFGIMFLFFSIFLRNVMKNPQWFISPPALFCGGLIIHLSFLSFFEITKELRLEHQFSIESAIFFVSFSTLFLFSSLIGIICIKTKNKNEISEKGPYHFSFLTCVLSGTIGSFKLIQGMDIHNLSLLIDLYLNNHYLLESSFFNSSWTLLWQANIAALFWFNFTDRKKTWPLVPLLLFSISLRAAFLYLTVAIFYLIVPIVYSFKVRKTHVYFFLFLIIFFMGSMFIKEGRTSEQPDRISPYSFGNFSSFNYYYETPSYRKITFEDIGLNMGLGQIFIYSNKYFGTKLRYTPSWHHGFLRQVKNSSEKGNVVPLQTYLIYLPLFLSLAFFSFLGFLCGFLFKVASSNLWGLSIYSWFAASLFMVHSGGGFFATTKFFPAMMYIWPFLLFYSIKDFFLAVAKP